MSEHNRPDWREYYLGIAKAVAARSTCLRRQYGAVIVNRDNKVIATGYNGAPCGESNCCDCGECEREAKNVPHGQGYSMCKSVHAEANAIISASREEMMGGTLYLYGQDANGPLENPEPCYMCRRLIKNAGIMRVVT